MDEPHVASDSPRIDNSGAGSHAPPPGSEAAAASTLEVVPHAEALDALRSCSIGRLAFIVDGWPVVLPVNFCLDGDDIVFRTDPGSKLLASQGSAPVAFEVDSTDPLYESGWSILAFGMANEVTEEAELGRLRRLPLRPWARGTKAHWVRIRVVQLTGRRVPRAWRYPSPPP
jgi:nitroimidazol reductase NimA-like FMN-containing flavoprotein (pyridoxamine 5'-phosphate oxidase superfamily)